VYSSSGAGASAASVPPDDSDPLKDHVMCLLVLLKLSLHLLLHLEGGLSLSCQSLYQ
jgi:hypothetical protein